MQLQTLVRPLFRSRTGLACLATKNTKRCCVTGLSHLSSRRHISTGVSGANAPPLDPQTPSEEKQLVEEFDTLLEVVRERSNPAYRSMMPMRTPLLWSEHMTSSQDPTASPPSPRPEISLEPRHMHDSYSQFVLPFRSDRSVFEQYTNAWGGIRTGKLMEHLDSLAGSIAYKHVLGPGGQMVGTVKDRGFYLVTAAADRLDMLKSLTPSNVRDLRLSGQVIYTGRSSIEVVVKMETLDEKGGEETVMLGRFSMACRDSYTKKARPVNPLILSTPEEKKLFALGEAHKARKQTMALRSLDRTPPSSEEAKFLHDFYLECAKSGSRRPGDSKLERVWMKDTRVEKCLLMFPQERNVHQKIFGGYLMRLAYELGYTNASMFTRRPLHFRALDGISFKHPVPIGSILRLRSTIAHTSSEDNFPALVHVSVQANVVDVPTGDELTTNEFKFTWSGDEPLTRVVVPKSYEEAMIWLEGKRALDMGAAIRGLRA